MNRFTRSLKKIEKDKDTPDIAVIGLAGKYPEADDINQFWENLKQGKDSVSEIPPDRWDHRLYFDEEKGKKGKAYSKWGGFINDVDKFDPLFFNISPREAELMDPQERLFLEAAWHALEDAGYTREAINKLVQEKSGKGIGVFAGFMWSNYQLYGGNSDLYSIANRISFLLGTHGPSMSINTACSSSLVAIHQACNSIILGECDYAIAGGVNISIHPEKYIGASQLNMLSTDGKCRSFGEGADGYVPGEGVGAILVKELDAAIRDGDQIYGVIKASSVNHDGKTNGYTVPNPKAQKELISQTLKKAGINPRTISYIEAHGTGTTLGDPIEIAGLAGAFREYTEDKQFCAIGSAKSNIGHCEGASGIAGLTKVLLQLKHKQLVPSLHSKKLNTNIDFVQSPFSVQQELGEWRRPTISQHEVPRRAGINSFGAGGTNAYLILEEYIPDENDKSVTSHVAQESAIILLSAKDEKQLNKMAQNLLKLIKQGVYSDNELHNIAYTLQVGREAMDYRLAFIVKSLNELKQRLTDFISNREDQEGIFQGKYERNNEIFSMFSHDEDTWRTIAAWIEKKKYFKLLTLWVKGLNLDWNQFYKKVKPKRISLPVYPFVKDRYWISDTPIQSADPKGSNFSNHFIHPLVHRNTSDFSEQRFSSVFCGNEFFLQDHVINGKPILPGAAYLEMARAAIEKAVAFQDIAAKIKLKEIVWIQPLVVKNHESEVHIGLYPGDKSEIRFEIYRNQDDSNKNKRVYCQGRAEISHKEQPFILDIDEIRSKCTKIQISKDRCYKVFQIMGIAYGESHQGMKELIVGENIILARISAPASVMNNLEQFYLHPALIDSAFQATIGFLFHSDQTLATQQTYLPFALDEMEIYHKTQPEMWAIINTGKKYQSSNEIKKMDIDLCDYNGKVCVRMKGFSSKPQKEQNNIKNLPENIESVLMEPFWREADVEQQQIDYSQHYIILIEQNKTIKSEIENQLNLTKCVELESKTNNPAKKIEIYALKLFNIIQEIFRNKEKGRILFQVVIPGIEDTGILSSLSAILKTAHLESPKLTWQLIEMENIEDNKEIIKRLIENSQARQCKYIKYKNKKPFIADWTEIEQKDNYHLPWQDQGVYLITGGTGGLGLLFADEIINKAKEPVLILTGRSPFNAKIEKAINKLTKRGAKVEYRQVDVTSKKSVSAQIEKIKKKWGELTGIIHSAGIINDNFIIKKDQEEFKKVIRPKINGVINLDTATKDLPLNFFVLFSSTAGALGNIGQVDYSLGNAFMDVYAKYRNNLLSTGKRYGHTVSINWPLWKNGGMHVDPAAENSILQDTGMVILDNDQGIKKFYQSFTTKKDQIMVIRGNLEQIKTKMFSHYSPSYIKNQQITLNLANGTEKEIKALLPEKEEQPNKSSLLGENIERFIINIIAQVLQLPVEKIETAEPLTKYGLDSIMMIEITRELEKAFGQLSKALLYEYETIEELKSFFTSSYPEKIQQHFNLEAEEKNNNVLDNDFISKSSEKRFTEAFINFNKDTTFNPVSFIEKDNIQSFHDQPQKYISDGSNLKEESFPAS
ncbi:MAG: type I polyketide synthase, partial [Spirochaetes bacterium]|nr:type I polyketide synthase [Spirochaetota bacterium]